LLHIGIHYIFKSNFAGIGLQDPYQVFDISTPKAS